MLWHHQSVFSSLDAMLLEINDSDIQKLTGRLSLLGKVQLPAAASLALNQTVQDIRKDLQDGARSTFKSTVDFTINAFRYKNSRPDNLEAVAFIREDAPKGNPPADYLLPHIAGTAAYRTRFAKGLGNSPDPSKFGNGGPILAPNEVMVPSQSPGGTIFTGKGNMSPGQYTTIYSQIDKNYQTFLSGEGGKSRKGRGRRGDRYFYMNQVMVDQRRNLKNRKPGVFLRRAVPGGDDKLYRVMSQIKTPSFTVKFSLDKYRASAKPLFDKYLSRQKFL
jgi:hypothetical protein